MDAVSAAAGSTLFRFYTLQGVFFTWVTFEFLFTLEIFWAAARMLHFTCRWIEKQAAELS